MANPTFEQLLTRFTALEPSAVAFEGTVYRMSTPKYATQTDLLTGAGSVLSGGRWDPKGVAAIYFSLSPETALAETLFRNRTSGVPIQNLMPRVIVAVNAKLLKVLDLRNGRIRQRLQVSVAKLLVTDWRAEVYAGRSPTTQQMGRAAHPTGWEALMVPSAADGGRHNLVVFPDRLAVESQLSVVNADELPEG